MSRLENDQNLKNEQNKTKPFLILFVCTGNSCRSPVAEGIFKSIIPENLQDKIQVMSAGTGGFVNAPATDFAIEVAAENGVELKNHRSQGLSLPLMKKADLVFVMAADHARHIRSLYYNLLDNVFLLKDFDREKRFYRRSSIADPIGRNKEFYKKNYKEIEFELVRILPRVVTIITARLAINRFSSTPGKETSG